MPELLAKAAIEVAPVTLAGITLAVAAPGPITFVAPFPGQEKPLAKALKPLGLTFPQANASSAKGAARLIWTGRGQAALLGVAAPETLGEVAALTDQSDAWVAFTLTGAGAEAVLARLVPVDLREAALPKGGVLRSALNHLPLILYREAEGFLILTFRSMARTAWHELDHALTLFAARANLPAD